MIQTVIARDSYEKILALLQKKWSDLEESGSFFAICQTEYDAEGNVHHDFLELIHEAVAFGYHYVNTIVYPTKEIQSAAFTDNVRYIVWLCKNRSEMRFCKDAIREKHIWKDVEWGKREKNYNPKGKDPGNVWIPTKDDGHAKITEHILLEDAQVIERLLAMSGCEEQYELHLEELKRAALPYRSASQRAAAASSHPEGRVFFKSSENMEEIADETVDVVITSPPYWNLKDYFKKGQIGQEPYTQYLERSKTVWEQCYAKLAAHGSLWLNINIRTKENDVVLLPYDLAKMCREVGFLYKGIWIWHKSSGIPTNDRNIVDRHEYVLVFAKSDSFCLNREMQQSYADYKNEAINGAAFWNINRKAGSVGKKYIHPAIYPNDLVRRIIRMTTPEDGVILDPFLGSGTSLIAALQCGRNGVGYEYNEGFHELMQHRFSKELGESGCITFYDADRIQQGIDKRKEE